MKTREELTIQFGKSGNYFFNVVRGIHISPVKPERIPKSLGAERTFSNNLTSELHVLEKLDKIAEILENRLNKHQLAGKTITLKIKYSDFKQQTRSKTLRFFIAKKELLLEHARELLFQDKITNSVRLLGIHLSNLNNVKKETGRPRSEKLENKQLTFPFE